MRELHDIPTGHPSVVLDNNLKILELVDGDGVERHVQQDEGPLEEGVDGVCCKESVVIWIC